MQGVTVKISELLPDSLKNKFIRVMKNFLSIFSLIKKRGLYTVFFATYYKALIIAYKFLKINFHIKKIYNFQMILDVRDRGLSRTLILFGQRELEHKYMLESYLKPGMSVLDIGANIGYYSLIELNLIGKNGTLIAVEPMRENINLLEKNLKLNKYEKIEIHEVAISNKNSIEEIYVSEMSNLNTFHNKGTGTEFLTGEKREVITKTVPSILDGRKIDLIRMDVEGHEIEVIQGMIKEIENNELSPAIIFETHTSRYNSDNHDIEPIIEKLFACGYYVSIVGSSSEEGTKRLQNLGYKKEISFNTDEVVRSVFRNIAKDDIIQILTSTGGIRTVLLEKKL
tara:strand:- start:8293 stop:9312 length:1020 start_codon:yes stop_codon:yes gene_type:complete